MKRVEQRGSSAAVQSQLKVSASSLLALKVGWPFRAVSSLPERAGPLGPCSDQPLDKGSPRRRYDLG